MNKKIKKEWLKKLRSGEYKQGKAWLKYKTVEGPVYCCLGVLAEVMYGTNIWKRKLTRANTGGYNCKAMDGRSDQLDMPSLDKCELSEATQTKLVSMNDNYEKTFKEIAAYISRYL